MAMDGIAVRCIAQELHRALVGARVDKIQQPERDELHLLFRGEQGNLRLLLSASASHPRAHLTQQKKENPASAPLFCMLLRKKLIPSRLISVSQVDFERTLRLDFAVVTELGDTVKRSLILELMGRHSNLIFLDEQETILDSIKHVDPSVSRVRLVLPGLSYTPAPSQNKKNPLTATRADWEEVLDQAPPEAMAADTLLANFGGLSPMTCREIVVRSGADADARLCACDRDALLESGMSFLAQVPASSFSPCLIPDRERFLEFAPYQPQQYPNTLPVATFSEALEQFYAGRDFAERQHQKTAALSKLVHNHTERLAKKITIFQKTIRDAETKEKFRLYGDLLMAHIGQIPEGADRAVVTNYYEESLPEVEIRLDPQKTVSQNAQQYYQRYTKQKTAEKMAMEQWKQAEEELFYLRSVEQFLSLSSNASEVAEIRRELEEQGYIKKRRTKERPTASKPASFQSSDGFTILVGRNNIQNDQITFKLSRSRDIWMHVKNIPGSHTLIRREDADQIPDRTLEEAALLCAAHSKAKNGVKVPVDYTEVKHVKKIAGAKPGMVTYEQFKTIFVTPQGEEL